MSSSFRASSRGVAALPEGEARRLFKGVVEGLRWLHKEEGVVHGDLKAENVLIDAEVSPREKEGVKRDASRLTLFLRVFSLMIGLSFFTGSL